MQSGISIFDETDIPKKPVIGAMIPKNMGFTIINVIGFDPIVAKIGNLVLHMRDSRFYNHVVVWLKTRHSLMDGIGVSSKSPIQGSTLLILGPFNQFEDQKLERKGIDLVPHNWAFWCITDTC